MGHFAMVCHQECREDDKPRNPMQLTSQNTVSRTVKIAQSNGPLNTRSDGKEFVHNRQFVRSYLSKVDAASTAKSAPTSILDPISQSMEPRRSEWNVSPTVCTSTLTVGSSNSRKKTNLSLRLNRAAALQLCRTDQHAPDAPPLKHGATTSTTTAQLRAPIPHASVQQRLQRLQQWF